ncbi:GntR family transcriptional regulator [Colwellia psychrerythraea]|uniref:Transcriptional regulator, GntR family with FCD sensor domain containing protein n=1 Tax=Colwellia psychrerythraea TaxID=28229 RepID=A0A099K6X5_COLPS|nr:GntR family transcriptional regulator [Colwellia psychrerythraea]KGJ86539.1 transcriptional regulator, GntR family with FCD sensor domain containing protein [Colwellia psychrerythraea]
MLETIRPQYKTITELVVESLRERIVIGEIKPGERIYQEVLAKEYNVSKIPIREALQLLNGEGYISIEANKGAIVSSINSEQIDELFALKILIETDMLAASLPLISDEKLKDAQQIIEKINMASSAKVWNGLNTEYYNCLYSGIRRPQTEEMITNIRTKIERFNHICFLRINKAKQYIAICKLLEHCFERKVDQAVEQLGQNLRDARDEIRVLL